jgi:hypothetical protein
MVNNDQHVKLNLKDKFNDDIKTNELIQVQKREYMHALKDHLNC